MEIAQPIPWNKYVEYDHAGACWIAHTSSGHEIDKSVRPRVIAVGPEGGFTDDELANAISHGWRDVSLGSRTLRIETAAIALAVLAVNL